MAEGQYALFLIAPAMISRGRDRAFGMKLPLLGYPAVSLATVAALTPENFTIRLIDEAYETVPFDEPCDLALIVGQTHHMPNVYSLADRLRKTGTRVVLAGMHVSALPDEALHHADSVIIHEAEPVWKQLLEDFADGNLKPRYEGPEADLADLPFMRRDIINRKLYHPGEIIETTRGCPVGCEFCAVKDFFGSRFRLRPPEQIKQELMQVFGPRPPQAKWKDWLAKHWHPDIPYFVERRLLYVLDSNFGSHPGHAREVLEVLKECDLRWYGHTSFNFTQDEAVLDQMADSGCIGLNIGFESLSQETVDSMGKTPNRTAQYVQTIQALHDRGIGVMGTFIVGFDQDRPEVFDQIADFVIANRLETAFVLILTPLPGTGVHREMAEQRRILSWDWGDYDHGTVTFAPKNMSPVELHRGMRQAWKRIYSWPNIARRILTGTKVRPFFYLPVNLGFWRCSRLVRSQKLWPEPSEEQ
jgi:radical SAM superfamily enzyme YgiQ (UPF0313 family)